MIDQLLTAWAAGVFEGEGTILFTEPKTGGTNPFITLQMAMTDFDVVERFAEIVGVGRLNEQPVREVHHLPQLRWTAYRAEDVGVVLEMFAPYLGERRRARANEVLRRWHEGYRISDHPRWIERNKRALASVPTHV